jgi:hypothetical protein
MITRRITQTNSSGNQVFMFSLKITAQFLTDAFGNQIEIERPWKVSHACHFWPQKGPRKAFREAVIFHNHSIALCAASAAMDLEALLNSLGSGELDEAHLKGRE